ncbi:hypothetical protein FIBSPDRAFT_996698 [Athelia psychrophila]|uniref:Uncharacterized protein n=1 Tax=Athelia psychrophila TaxID=1759441 RepID=A0A165WSC6_9AGAM|nr:hypothetical protein FIBSPDRAFT_996698 [Fibularhizoctonia sp. CBS 109695]
MFSMETIINAHTGRDLQSFPDAVPAARVHIHNDVTLPHVDRVVGYDEETVASQNDMWLAGHPPLEHLITKYGDSSESDTHIVRIKLKRVISIAFSCLPLRLCPSPSVFNFVLVPALYPLILGLVNIACS